MSKEGLVLNDFGTACCGCCEPWFTMGWWHLFSCGWTLMLHRAPEHAARVGWARAAARAGRSQPAIPSRPLTRHHRRHCQQDTTGQYSRDGRGRSCLITWPLPGLPRVMCDGVSQPQFFTNGPTPKKTCNLSPIGWLYSVSLSQIPAGSKKGGRLMTSCCDDDMCDM